MKTFLALALAAFPLTAFAADITGKVDVTPAKYLAETIVYVEKAPGTFPPKAHKMDQKGMQFLPHLLIATVGDTVDFLNSDGVAHNVYSPDGGGYNLAMIEAGKSGKHTFDKPGTYSQLCSVHPEMLGYVFVGQNPFAAVVGKDGTYQIKNVPPGQYTVALWNSHLKAKAVSVTLGAEKAEANFSVKR